MLFEALNTDELGSLIQVGNEVFGVLQAHGHADETVGDALRLMADNHIGGIPVVAEDRTLVGIVTNRDVRFITDSSVRIEEVMTSENRVTLDSTETDREYVMQVLQQHKIEKVPVVDSEGKLVGLITY